MRIELVCASRELFGADRSAVRLAQLLASLGHDVSLTAPAQRPELGLAGLAGRRGVELTAGPVVVASSRGVSGLLGGGRGRSDLDLTIYNSAAVALRRGDRRPRVLVLREWLDPGRRAHRALVALHRRRVDRVVAVSAAVAHGWRALAGERVPVQVCPNWLDPDWLAPAETPDRDGILFCGRLNAWKGQLLLADAYERAFVDGGPRPGLTFLGAEGPGSPFREHAIALERRCHEVGARLLEFGPDPRPVFERAALVVVPSLRPEPFGNVILEGLAGGARVLAFPGGGVDDLAPAFPGALHVVDRGLDGLSAGLERWWREGGGGQPPELYERTLATLRERFSADAAAPRWREVVDQATAAA
jgi:glycosyltransferase involved in cell wall biosynthesis